MQGKQFGKMPSGKRTRKNLKITTLQDGKIKTSNRTPQLAEDTSMPKVLFNFFFSKVENFHYTKTDLKTYDLKAFGWGHFLFSKLMEKNLVDPVFSGSFSAKNSPTKLLMEQIFTPHRRYSRIRLFAITHDHLGSIETETVTKLRPKVKQVITGLGTGAF